MKITDSQRIDILYKKISELTERVNHLDGKEPKLKQLDQSVFDGQTDDKRFFAIDEDGEGWFFRDRPSIIFCDEKWMEPNYTPTRAGFDYDASNWQDSLIERETKELTGSDLCRKMLERGDKFVLCGVSDGDDSDATNHEDDDFLAEAVTDFDDTDGLFGTTSMRWLYAVPINNQGEPLTQSEVGL